MVALWKVVLVLWWTCTMTSLVWAQTSNVCPDTWVLSNNVCYKFVLDPPQSYEHARAHCAELGTSLLSVNTQLEHDFIINWLQTNDYYRHEWFTSGYQTIPGSTTFVWRGDNTMVPMETVYWTKDGKITRGEAISYKSYGITYGLSRSLQVTPKPYICEIVVQEAYRLISQRRDFGYGRVIDDPEDIPRGPQLTIQPKSLTVVTGFHDAVLECAAVGNPTPKYKWYRVSKKTKKEVDYSERCTKTSGKLIIQKPTEEKDAGTYQCEVENVFGKIFSNPVSISFGHIGEFSNVRDAPVYAYAYNGAVIQCSAIQVKPAAVYNWQRGRSESTKEFIFSETTPYIFISNNGNLYFSEVTPEDVIDYYCQVTLSSTSSSYLGTSQAPSKTSLPISLIVLNAAARANWGPEIQDDFIAVFPNPPLRGQDLRMECFAYGSAPGYLDHWTYSWTRDDGNPMPPTVEFEDFSRVMIIREVQLSDEGPYTCHVRRDGNNDKRQTTLKLESKPYFIVPLQNQHVDKGGLLTWRCYANAYPEPEYAWYKDGDMLTSSNDGSVVVSKNILTIRRLDSQQHNGMYQCSATNVHGTSISAAQLRVLAFAPSFAKSPIPKQLAGALNGNVSIPCRPEASPQPQIKWLKNGGDMNLRILSIDSPERIKMLATGDLHITGLNQGDAGLYTCEAENEIGKERDSGRLVIQDATVITRAPKLKDSFQVNETAFIPCVASFDRRLDIIYTWKLNGHPINVEKNAYYRQVNSAHLNGLYIQNIQLEHDGVYECVAKTPLNFDTKSGRIEVTGPPGEPAGVFADGKSVSPYSIVLHWFPGRPNGPPILFYIIEAETQYTPGVWKTMAMNIPDKDTLTPAASTSGNQDPDMRSYLVKNLKPGNSYRFRVQAINRLGFGRKSIPSTYYTTLGAPPVVVPSNIRGGNGSVGDLTMKWDRLSLEDRGGSGVGYNLYWRLYDPNPLNKDNVFTMKTIRNPDQEKFIQLVGDNNFYLQYEFIVQAFNDYGKGPNSSVHLIYSAEGMPVLAPQNVYADGFNSTAMEVTWDPIPDTREAMKGRVLGYQINYWSQDDEVPYYVRYIRVPGNVDNAMCIGLWADSWFIFEVQVYNSAGLGPLSETFAQETQHSPPTLYPQEVWVWSHSATSVRVTWRGVSTAREEDVIEGYYIYLWPANEHFRTAEMIETDKYDNLGFILKDLTKDKVYAMRIAGFSLGGEGKKSPTVYFTLGGQVMLDPVMSEIQATASSFISSKLLIFFSTTVIFLMSTLSL